jgi:glutamate synthase (NADPH/NADH) large chain
MVDLDPLELEDQAWLRDVIRAHQRETGSPVAERILDAWHTEVRAFAKVMPKDYKRVLEAARVAEERGIPVDEFIMAASNG